MKEATMPLFYLPYIIYAGLFQVMFDSIPGATRPPAEKISAE
jgi:hypothetical protein